MLARLQAQKGARTYSRLPERRKAIGASGSMIVPQAFWRSTLQIALRFNFFPDFEPKVAASLGNVSKLHLREAIFITQDTSKSSREIEVTRYEEVTDQMVATPYLRFVKTKRD